MFKNNKGFTLVELLAVIVVLAIIMVIATQSVGKSIIKARTQAFESNMDLAVKNAKNILSTEGKLDSESLKNSLDYDDKEYDYDVYEFSDGNYFLRILSTASGKFKNVDFETISKNNNYNYEDSSTGINIIGVKISLDGNIEKIDDSNNDEKIISENSYKNGCTKVDNKNLNKYEKGYQISFCNDSLYYDRYNYEYVRGKSEDFYVIASDDKTVTMIAKNNILASGNSSSPIKDNFGIVQTRPGYGAVIEFDDDKSRFVSPSSYLGYWVDDDKKIKSDYGKETYPVDVYNDNRLIKKEVDSYVSYLKEKFKKNSIKGRLITLDDLKEFGVECKNCKCENGQNIDWLYSGNYWSSTACSNEGVYNIIGSNGASWAPYYYFNKSYGIGIRPVIEIDKSEL